MPRPDDFSVSVSSGSSTVVAGSSTTVRVTVTNPGATPISLAVDGLPPRVMSTWRPQRLTAGGSATVSLATSPDTPPGTYPLGLRAVGGQVSRTAPFNLIVVRPRRTASEVLAGTALTGVTAVAWIVGRLVRATSGRPPARPTVAPPQPGSPVRRRDTERV